MILLVAAVPTAEFLTAREHLRITRIMVSLRTHEQEQLVEILHGDDVLHPHTQLFNPVLLCP